MAYFERADERDRLILCNICNVKCSERSITNHKAKCSQKHPNKFASGALKRCNYDSSHIVEADIFDLHLEFCTKRQSEIVAQYQEEYNNALNGGKTSAKPASDTPVPDVLYQSSEDWGRDANMCPYISKALSKNLKLN